MILGKGTGSGTKPYNAALCTLNSVSSISYNKGTDGKYPTLSVPSAANSAFVKNTKVTLDTGAQCVFVKTSETGDFANYSLYPEVMVGYKIKTSVTLYTNFVYNIYVPKTAAVLGISINGVALANTDYVVTDATIGTDEYYKISVSLAASESLSDIAVKVTLKSGKTSVDASWVVDLLSYAKKVIAGNYSEVEKTLAKDMLSYAKAAYVYFNNANDADKVAEIGALLGEDVRLPDMNKEAKEPAKDRGFTGATLNLGDVPSYRFYLANGFTKDDFTFKVGNSTIEVIEGTDKNGAYLEVVMYAYRMCDTVTYTVTIDGVTYTESYNIYAYYNYAKTKYPENEALHAIVERLAAYSESAAEYKKYATKD